MTPNEKMLVMWIGRGQAVEDFQRSGRCIEDPGAIDAFAHNGYGAIGVDVDRQEFVEAYRFGYISQADVLTNPASPAAGLIGDA